MKSKIFLSTFYYKPEIGGIENHLSDVLDVSQRNFIVSRPYIIDGGKKALDSNDKNIYCYQGFKSIISKNKKYYKWLLPLIYINQFLSGYKILRRHRGQIAVVYAGSGDFMLVPLVLSKIFRLPLVIFVHGNDIQPRKSLLSKLYKRKILLYMLSLSKVVVANSHYTESILRNGGYRRNNIILLNPFLGDNTIENVKPRLDTESEKNSFTLLTVGRMVQRKGYQSVLYALKLLKDDGIDFKYKIVGDGPYKNEVLGMIGMLGLEDHVDLLGVVDETAAYYQAADVFIMPSIELPGDVEGFGIVFLEAGLQSLAVISSLSGGIPDAVVNGVTGLLVKPGDVEEIVAAIKLLMNDVDLRIRMGRAGYKKSTDREQIILAIDEIETRISHE